jgi:hypothetical protein
MKLISEENFFVACRFDQKNSLKSLSHLYFNGEKNLDKYILSFD